MYNDMYPAKVNWDCCANLGINVPNKGKKMFDITKPYMTYVDYQFESYATLDEATDAAKKSAQKREEDVAVMKITSVVKFPVPDYAVVAVD